MFERTARFVAPATVVLFAVLAAALGDRSALVGVAGVVGIGLVVAVLAVRAVRGWPLVAGCVVALAGFSMLAGGTPANVGWFGVCVLAGWASFYAARLPAVVFAAVAVADFAVLALVVSSDAGWGAWIAGTVFTTVACLLAAEQAVLLDRLRAAQSELAERTRTEERARVAREMHDVIGHALTVTLLHISSARLAVDDEPQVARAALEEAERHARRSLDEIRASVGLLRDDTAATTPLPGANDLEALVDSYRRTGAAVSCDVVGDVSRLSPTTGLAAYRIVQESLTNAARHAPGAPTRVEVRVDDTAATVVVDSAGEPRPDAPHGSGLLGMRERAEAVGGHVTAGPAGHGWRVEAVLPT